MKICGDNNISNKITKISTKEGLVLKRKSKITLSLCFAVSIIISSIIPSAASSVQESQDNLMSKVLDDYTKTKLDTDHLKDEKICDYEGNYSSIVNSKSLSVMEYFGMKSNDIKNIDLVKDNMLDKTVYKVELDHGEIKFDESGNLVQFFNFDDSIDHSGNSNTVEYTLNNSDDLQSIINSIYTQNELENYTLIDCSNNLVGVWVLRWNKDIGNGVLNPYDTVTAVIDAEDGSIISFARNTILPNATSPIVTKKEALKFAKPIMEKIDNYNYTNIELTVFRPNFYWEDEAYEQADFIRLAWKITLDDGTLIYIDAETGEILGGNQTEGNACAARVVTAVEFNEEKLDYAYDGLNALGYNTDIVGWSIPQIDAEWLLKDCTDLKALYINCHGFTNGLVADLNGTDSLGNNWTVYTTDFRHTGWNFVFLDACDTCTNSMFANALGLNGSSDSRRCFVGWHGTVYYDVSFYFNANFWQYIQDCINGGQADSIHNAVIYSLTVCNNNALSCNPGFYGDRYYDGTYANGHYK